VNERERRLGENEVLYREVNERVRQLQDGFGVADERIQFVCECAAIDCHERIPMSIGEYEHVRDDPARFALRPGHEVDEVESVLEEHDGYNVIEKRAGGPAELAAAKDPRS
jgi:hypothetical protein